VNHKRPVNLDLSTIKFPLPALTSITHRVAGVALFVGVAFLLVALSASLESEQGFSEIKSAMTSGFGSFITWGLLSALGYHFVAGIKHLVMDMGIGETKEGGQVLAVLTILFGGATVVLAGVWVWA